MAQIAQYTCDRCGDGMNGNDLCWMRVSFSHYEGKDTVRLDLCSTCEQKFKEFLGVEIDQAKETRSA